MALVTLAGFLVPAVPRGAIAQPASRLPRFAGAGVTAYWYFSSSRPNVSDGWTSRPAQANLEVVPWVQSRFGGAAIAGRL
jgi:hypothetical protein